MDSGGEYELEAADRDTVENAAWRYDTTNLTVTYDSTPVFSGSGETDIIYQEGSTGLPASAAGIYWCNAGANGTYECDQGYVRIRGAGDYNTARTCHETGHAVGLTHGNNADPYTSQTANVLHCMETPSSGSDGILGDNNKINVNFWY